jgi:hypothetical protein
MKKKLIRNLTNSRVIHYLLLGRGGNISTRYKGQLDCAGKMLLKLSNSLFLFHSLKNALKNGEVQTKNKSI